MNRDFLRQGAQARQALDRLQVEIAATEGAIETLKGAPLPLEEVRERLLGMIKDGIRQWQPADAFSRLQDRIYDPRIAGRVRGVIDTLTGEEFLLTQPMSIFDLAWLDGPEVLADMIMTRIKANGRPVGPPLAKYTAEMERLRTKLDGLERAEEIETLRLEAAGHVILRRENVQPDLLMRIWSEQQVDRAAA